MDTTTQQIKPEVKKQTADMSQAKWYIVHTYSGHENKVAETLKQRAQTLHLTDKILQVLVPTQEKIQIKRGQRKTVREKIFPGYMLVMMDLTDDSWVTLKADGKTVVNDELKSGDHRTFEAHDEFFFSTVGNPEGLAMTMNGVRIPPLGKHGRAVHKRAFDRAWLKAHSVPEGTQTTP